MKKRISQNAKYLAKIKVAGAELVEYKSIDGSIVKGFAILQDLRWDDKEKSYKLDEWIVDEEFRFKTLLDPNQDIAGRSKEQRENDLCRLAFE